MLLHTICDYLPHNQPFTLHIENSKQSLIFNINKPTIYKNTILFNDTHILFTTPNQEALIFNDLKSDEIEYLITKLNNLIATLNLPEDISIFYFDQIFNRNLFKFYNNPMNITHIISSNENIHVKRDNNQVIIKSDKLNINALDQKTYNNIIKNELKHSLIFIKLNNTSAINIQLVFRLLNQFGYIINYDNHSHIFTVNLKAPIALPQLAKLAEKPIAIIDRSNDLNKYLN